MFLVFESDSHVIHVSKYIISMLWLSIDFVLSYCHDLLHWGMLNTHCNRFLFISWKRELTRFLSKNVWKKKLSIMSIFFPILVSYCLQTLLKSVHCILWIKWSFWSLWVLRSLWICSRIIYSLSQLILKFRDWNWWSIKKF